MHTMGAGFLTSAKSNNYDDSDDDIYTSSS